MPQMPSDNDNVPARPLTVPPHWQPRAGPTPDFMKYPYPESGRILTHLDMLPGVTEGTRRVVVLILDYGLQPSLNSSEVTSIFAQPLISFLSSTPHLSSGRTADPNNPYHTFTDFPWSDGGAVRLHEFLTGREGKGVKPVFGLTAAILIKTATIGYVQTPEFEVQPPNAPTAAQQIAYALLTPANPLRIACGQEGIDANKTATRLLRPPMAASAARTIKWKKFMDGDDAADVSTRVNVAAGKGRGSGSGSRAAPGDRKPGSEAPQKRIKEIKMRVQDQVHSGNGEGMEGFNVKIEEYKKQARECQEQAGDNGEERRERREECRDAISDMSRLGEFLDKTWDMVGGRMKEVKGDEEKLVKARKAYPKIVEQARKQVEEARNENGELGPKALFAMIPKEGQEGLKGSINAGKEGIRRGKSHVHDGEGRDQGIERGKESTRRGLEEMKKYIGKGGDGHNPEQTSPKKRDVKL